jgi:hypothetical protein
MTPKHDVLKDAAHDEQFMLRRLKDGEWLAVFGWTCDWIREPHRNVCPVFTNANTGNNGSEWHRFLCHKHLDDQAPAQRKCLMLKVVPKEGTTGLYRMADRQTEEVFRLMPESWKTG